MSRPVVRVVGAGFGRTGTSSLKLALERLLGGRCYHMSEVDNRPQDVSLWQSAAEGRMPAWGELLDGYVAAVDWPSAGFWPELAAEYPDSLVLLSRRRTPQEWWGSYSRTIVASLSRSVAGEDMPPHRRMIRAVLQHRFTPQWDQEVPAVRAYSAHLATVRAGVPARRLIEWEPGEGWQPLCAGLGLAVPLEPFPRVNSATEFRLRSGLDEPPGREA